MTGGRNYSSVAAQVAGLGAGGSWEGLGLDGTPAKIKIQPSDHESRGEVFRKRAPRGAVLRCGNTNRNVSVEKLGGDGTGEWYGKSEEAA